MIKLVLIFIVIYITFMAVAIDYAKVFRVKNNVINILEQNQFLMNDSYTSNTLTKIDSYLATVPYNEYGNNSVARDCANNGGVNSFGGKQLVTTAGVEAGAGSKILTQNGVCITRMGNNDDIYYKVTAYISIEFPFFDLYFTIPISGETKMVSI